MKAKKAKIKTPKPWDGSPMEIILCWHEVCPCEWLKNSQQRTEDRGLLLKIIFTGLALGLESGNVGFKRNYVNTEVSVQHLLSSWESEVWDMPDSGCFHDQSQTKTLGSMLRL